MYGYDSDDSPSDARPNSFLDADRIPGPVSSSAVPSSSLKPESAAVPDSSSRLLRSISERSSTPLQSGPNGLRKSMTVSARPPNSNGPSTYDAALRQSLSPTFKDVQEDAQFPLTNIENPNDIAQELSNLQALRRMSMDVGNTTTDPDLMFSSNNNFMTMPSVAPTGDDDGTDPSRLLWVPASVHPELAPMEFKTFLERRVTAMKRRSSESSLSPEGSEKTSASGILRRKKSMLSRQIDRGSADGSVDGSERLERKRSLNGAPPLPELTLDELVKDPTKAVQKLQHKDSKGRETSMSDDLPLLPMQPGMGLRRSTCTKYQKGGSLRAKKALPFSKRIQQKASEAESADVAPKIEGPSGFGLARVQSEPISENFSRPTRTVRRQQKFSSDSTSSTVSTTSSTEEHDNMSSGPEPFGTPERELPVRISSIASSRSAAPVQSVAETSLFEEEPQLTHPTHSFPQRSSSQNSGTQVLPQLLDDESASKSGTRSVSRPLNTPQSIKQSSRDQRGEQQSIPGISQSSSGLPNNDTGSMVVIPTFSSEEKREKKGKKHKDDDAESPSVTKSGWKWFKGGSDGKEKKKQQPSLEEEKKSKGKSQGEKPQDIVRLDVIDNAIGRGRESFAMERDSPDSKMHEERKKEGHKKGGESKKEKDGLFASIFGGGKKKSDKESSKKHHSHRAVSPEPSYRELVPDRDYNWTRFPLIKERAIYRLAHMKLANPRRSLQSQVLLSNFMYSYLAKVQAMHPQMQVPQSPQQKRLEEERRRKGQEDQYLLEQQMQQEAVEQDKFDHYSFEYHRVSSFYLERLRFLSNNFSSCRPRVNMAIVQSRSEMASTTTGANTMTTSGIVKVCILTTADTVMPTRSKAHKTTIHTRMRTSS